MSDFLCILQCDIRFGLKKMLPRFILLIAVSAFILFISYVSIYRVELRDDYGHAEYALGFGDALLCLLGGIKVYDPAKGMDFRFPMTWIALLAVTAYITLDYPLKNLGGIGAHMISISGSRWAWWLAKCCWVIVACLLASIILFLACMVLTMIGGGSGTTPLVYTVTDLSLFGQGTRYVPQDLLSFALVVPIILCALMLIQLVVSLLAGPYIAFGVTAAFLVFGSYYHGPWLLAEYAMAARTDAILTYGLVPQIGALYGLGVMIICIVGGGMLFKRKDILAGRGNKND